MPKPKLFFCFSDFLKKILVDNPKRRLTIPLLKKEKWYTRYVIAAVNLPVSVFHSLLWLKGAISIFFVLRSFNLSKSPRDGEYLIIIIFFVIILVLIL